MTATPTQASSSPPTTRALRLYGSSGFRLSPTFDVDGRPHPELLPEPNPLITEAHPSELETLAPISRAVRGAAHTRDFSAALVRDAEILRLEDRGFVVTMPGRGIWALAARDEQAATALLWAGLHRLRDEPRIQISFIGGDQQWALEVLLAARLSFRSYGAIATRGAVGGPLYPYIPSPSFA